MRLVDTVIGMGGGRMKKSDGGGEFNYEILLALL
jgi:hypothetical protein